MHDHGGEIFDAPDEYDYLSDSEGSLGSDGEEFLNLEPLDDDNVEPDETDEEMNDTSEGVEEYTPSPDDPHIHETIVPRAEVRDRPTEPITDNDSHRLSTPVRGDEGYVLVDAESAVDLTPEHITSTVRAMRDGTELPRARLPTEDEKHIIHDVWRGSASLGKNLGIPLYSRRTPLKDYHPYDSHDDLQADLSEIIEGRRTEEGMQLIEAGILWVRNPDSKHVKDVIAHEMGHEKSALYAVHYVVDETGQVGTAIYNSYGNLRPTNTDHSFMFTELACEYAGFNIVSNIGDDSYEVGYASGAALGHAALEEMGNRMPELNGSAKAAGAILLKGLYDGRQAPFFVDGLTRALGEERAAAFLNIDPAVDAEEGIRIAEELELPRAKQLLEDSDHELPVFFWNS